MSHIKTLLHYWKSITAIVCILYLSFSGPATFDKVPNFTYKDKIAHFILYGGLTLLLIHDRRRHKTNNTSYLSFVMYCIVFPILLGGLVEIFQQYIFFPRTAEWLDWVSDIAGVLAGWYVMNLLKKTPKYTTLRSK